MTVIEDEANKMYQHYKKARKDDGIFTRAAAMYVDPDAVKQIKEKFHITIVEGTEQAIRRMLDMGYSLEDLELNQLNVDGGFLIEVRAKREPRDLTELEYRLQRLFLGVEDWKTHVRNILDYFARSRDISFTALRKLGLPEYVQSDLRNTLFSIGYADVECDLYHDCRPGIPVGSVVVKEGTPKPKVKTCPACEQKIEPMTSYWGGYRYMLSKYQHDIQKQSRLKGDKSERS